MMGPDYTHWHGTYEVAKHLHADFLPEIRKLTEKGMHAAGPAEKKPP
jgi:hypothetical protein